MNEEVVFTRNWFSFVWRKNEICETLKFCSEICVIQKKRKIFKKFLKICAKNQEKKEEKIRIFLGEFSPLMKNVMRFLPLTNCKFVLFKRKKVWRKIQGNLIFWFLFSIFGNFGITFFVRSNWRMRIFLVFFRSFFVDKIFLFFCHFKV